LRNVVGARQQQQQKQRHARIGLFEELVEEPANEDSRAASQKNLREETEISSQPSGRSLGFFSLPSGDKMADKHVIITSHTHQARRRQIQTRCDVIQQVLS
jgi:hypothetical protein